jgi:hypothetical protein
MTFGFTPKEAERFCAGYKTYYAYGRYNVLLPFCGEHFEQAAIDWPGLIAAPVQPVHRRWDEGRAAVESLKRRLKDPAVRRKVLSRCRPEDIDATFFPDRQRTLRGLLADTARRVGVDIERELSKRDARSILYAIRSLKYR